MTYINFRKCLIEMAETHSQSHRSSLQYVDLDV